MGFERLNSTMTEKKELWWFNYGRTWVRNLRDVSPGQTKLGKATVTTKVWPPPAPSVSAPMPTRGLAAPLELPLSLQAPGHSSYTTLSATA